MTGSITGYNPSRRYGFLVADDGREFCFHDLDTGLLPNPVKIGQRVEFLVLEHQGRKRAVFLAPADNRVGIDCGTF